MNDEQFEMYRRAREQLQNLKSTNFLGTSVNGIDGDCCEMNSCSKCEEQVYLSDRYETI